MKTAFFVALAILPLSGCYGLQGYGWGASSSSSDNSSGVDPLATLSIEPTPSASPSAIWDGTLSQLRILDQTGATVGLQPIQAYFSALGTTSSAVETITLSSSAIDPNIYKSGKSCPSAVPSASPSPSPSPSPTSGFCTDGNLTFSASICFRQDYGLCQVSLPIPFTTGASVSFDLSQQPNPAGYFPYPLTAMTATLCVEGAPVTYVMDLGNFDTTLEKFTYNRSGTVKVTRFDSVPGGRFSVHFSQVSLLNPLNRTQQITVTGDIALGDVVQTPACLLGN